MLYINTKRRIAKVSYADAIKPTTSVAQKINISDESQNILSVILEKLMAIENRLDNLEQKHNCTSE